MITSTISTSSAAGYYSGYYKCYCILSYVCPVLYQHLKLNQRSAGGTSTMTPQWIWTCVLFYFFLKRRVNLCCGKSYMTLSINIYVSAAKTCAGAKSSTLIYPCWPGDQPNGLWDRMNQRPGNLSLNRDAWRGHS